MRTLLCFLLLLPLTQPAISQDTAYVREIIDSLCAPRYHGRGYVHNGDVKAGDFLIRQCQEKGLRPVHGTYEQDFTLGVNTFPGEMTVRVNGMPLETGIDFIPDPQSPGIEGSFRTFRVKPRHVASAERTFRTAQRKKVQTRVAIIDATDQQHAIQSLVGSLNEDPLNAEAYVVLTDKKLTWSVGRRMIQKPIVQVRKPSMKGKARSLDLHIDQEWKDSHRAKNIMAMIPGKKDSLVVFTAHYDHLGRMGADTYIAGASDNASGTAMLLDLADHYRAHPPEYTTLFIWFAGEEAGLVGSRYFVEKSPPIDVASIKFLLNLDLMADAKKGITLVNGKIFTDAYDRMVALNEANRYLDVVKARGAAANSDHYPFYEQGVPCFFIYTMGDYKHYHDVHDVPEHIPLTNYNEVFRLIVDFVERGF